MTDRTEPGVFYDLEARAAARAARARGEMPRDRELIPRRLVIAMFALALSTLLIVSYAVLTGRPHVGTPQAAPIVTAQTFVLGGEGRAVTAITPDGTVLMDTDNGGFISVVREGLERARLKAGIAGNPAVTLARHENGRLSLTDPATGWEIELTSFGRFNSTVWAPLID